MKEITQVRINKSFWIERSGHGFVLVEMVPSKDSKGNDKLKEKLRFYGTVYQALQGFLKAQVDDTHGHDFWMFQRNLKKRVENSLKDIKAAEEDIKATFCIELKSSN